MAFHTFTISISLSDEEYQTVARAAAGMALHFQQQNSPIEWSMENELRALLCRAISDERHGQQQRDNIATILRYGGHPFAPAAAPAEVPMPAWLEAIDPMEAFPADLAGELDTLRERNPQ